MAGGLYTLNCESVAGCGCDAGSATAAAAVVTLVVGAGSVLEGASDASGAVDARVGGDGVAAGCLLLLGVDIGPS